MVLVLTPLTSLAVVSVLRVIGGAGNDTFTFEETNLNASIVGGAGDDSINMATATIGGLVVQLTPTSSDLVVVRTPLTSVPCRQLLYRYYRFTIAVDSAYGATSSYSFASGTGKLSFGNDNNYLTISGVTGTSANSPSALGITFTTVATSVIAALG